MTRGLLRRLALVPPVASACATLAPGGETVSVTPGEDLRLLLAEHRGPVRLELQPAARHPETS